MASLILFRVLLCWLGSSMLLKAAINMLGVATPLQNCDLVLLVVLNRREVFLELVHNS